MKFTNYLFILTSCNENLQVSPEGSYEPTTRVFRSQKINWEVSVPEDWVITHIDTVKSQLKRGVEMIDQNKTGPNVKKEANVKNLIGFKKNNRNSFTAILEEVNYDRSEFPIRNRQNKEFILKQLEKQGLSADTAWSTKIIDNESFEVFQLLIDLPEPKNDFHQYYYNAFLSNHLFTIIIGYDNPEDKIQLIKTIDESKFFK